MTRQLRSRAKALASSQYTRLVLIWAGAAAGLSLAAGLLNYLLDTGIAGTGGLDGMGLRGLLSTAQSVLTMAASLLLPFWSLGYLAATLGMARQQPVSERTLLSGFRRFGPGLRLTVLEGLVYGLLCMGVTYLSVMILAMTPLARPVVAVMEPMMEALLTDPSWMPSQAQSMALLEAMLPMLLWAMGLCLLVTVPVSYRLRFARLRLMDDPGCGARAALKTSFYMTKGHCLDLVKLDLGYWWFYLLELLILALSYGDTLLPLLGVSLPFGPELAFWLFYVLALVLQVAVYTVFHNRVSIAYALYYDSLLEH